MRSSKNQPSSIPGQFYAGWIASLVLTVLISFGGVAQLKRFPITRHAPISGNKTTPQGRIKSGLPLDLPFFEDFASTPVDDMQDTTSNYPSIDRWENSYSTWITSATGINLPTINAAVLDGVDSIGRSYSDAVLSNGFRDKLQSRPIDLSPAKVSVAERANVRLSFKYQWGGNGEPPDPTDYLNLEFKDSHNEWKSVMTIYPKVTMQTDIFYDTVITIANNASSDYYHDKFQFRFRAYGRQSGPYDTWIVDYIYLNKNRTADDYKAFNDIAIASPMSPLFGRYYAKPLKTFLNAKRKFSNVTFDVHSLQDDQENRTYSHSAVVQSYVGDVAGASTSYPLGIRPVKGAAGNIDEFERFTVVTTDTLNPIVIDTTADAVDISYKVNLIANALDAEPTLAAFNDTLNATYHLRDYYAYDDGSAEYSVALTQPGNKVLYAFDIDTTQYRRVAGIEVYSPQFGITEASRIDFLIYGHDEATNGPGELLLTLPSTAISRQKPNVFQRIIIPAGSPEDDINLKDHIYIGWVAPVTSLFHVGLDYSNDTSDKVFVSTSGGFEPSNDIKGSIMIRPIFGQAATYVGVDDEYVEMPLYPNPSKGEFFIDERSEVETIINMLGQRIHFDTALADGQRKVSMLQRAPGVYLVRIKKGSSRSVRKILVN